MVVRRSKAGKRFVLIKRRINAPWWFRITTLKSIALVRIRLIEQQQKRCTNLVSAKLNSDRLVEVRQCNKYIWKREGTKKIRQHAGK